MKQKKNKQKRVITVCFIIGLLLYLVGLFLLFGTKFSHLEFFRNLFANSSMSTMKLIGIILFTIGFIIFMLAVVFLYKNNSIKDTNWELIVEGKADVITIMVMTYLMIFMLVICLIFDEVIGAMLFGIAILVQCILNGILIKYFTKNGR